MNPAPTSRRSVSLPVIAAVVYLFLYLPLGIVVLESFNATRYGNAWGGFTLQWYRQLTSNSDVLNALRNTLYLALTSTVISTIIGSLLGYGLARHPFRGRKQLKAALHLPICIPDIVLAVALLLFFGMARVWFTFLELGLLTMILGHITFQIPFVALVIKARLAGADHSIEEAAIDLGATRLQRIRYITIPMLGPGIMAGAMLAFTLSLDDFVVSFFTAGAGSTTLPVLIYSSVKRGITPEIHALSALLILASILATCGIMLLQRKSHGTNSLPIHTS